MSMNRILKTIQTSESLHTVSIRALVAIGKPEILLNADWETFCAEVIRVKSKESFTITLWMDYTFESPTDIEISVFRDQLNRRCKSILSKPLVPSLVNSPGCTIVLGHTIHGADYY